MRSTVFLDETGSFRDEPDERRTNPWIVSGFTMQCRPKLGKRVLDEHLSKVVHNLLREEWFQDFERFVGSKYMRFSGESTDKKLRPLFHLGEQIVTLRDKPACLHGRAFTQWKSIYERETAERIGPQIVALRAQVLDVLDDPRIAATRILIVNESQPSPFHSVNYALTLQEAVLPLLSTPGSGTLLPRFVIAYRTSEDDIGRDSTDDVRAVILESQYANALASGLASSHAKVPARFPRNTIAVLRQEDNSGLAVADFVCSDARFQWLGLRPNLNRSQKRHELETVGYFVQWLGEDLHNRRVVAALAQQDIASATLYAIQGLPETRLQIQDIVGRLLVKTSIGDLRHNIEGIITRVDAWARVEDKILVLSSLQDFMHAYYMQMTSLPKAEQGHVDVQGVLLRLASYVLVWANHVGDESTAKSLESAIRGTIPRISGSKMWEEAVYSFEVGCIERAINEHRPEDALASASEHLANCLPQRDATKRHEIESLKALVGGSHVITRAHTVFLRAVALDSAARSDVERMNEVFDCCLDSVAILADFTQSRDDRVRLLWIACFIAEHLSHEEVGSRLNGVVRGEIARSTYSEYFDAVVLRIAATQACSANSQLCLADEVVSRLSGIDLSEVSVRHPMEIVLREMLLLKMAIDPESPVIVPISVRLRRWATELSPKAEVHRHQLRLWGLIEPELSQKSPKYEEILRVRRSSIY